MDTIENVKSKCQASLLRLIDQHGLLRTKSSGLFSRESLTDSDSSKPIHAIRAIGGELFYQTIEPLNVRDVRSIYSIEELSIDALVKLTDNLEQQYDK